MNVKEKIAVLGRPGSAHPGESHGAPSVDSSMTSGTKAERQAAALQLWNKWASDALGPMSADPTPEDLSRKSRRVQRLEHECAAIAAQAQRRLELSSALRSTPVVLGATAGATGPGAGAALQTGAFSREMQYAVRERRKAAAYAAVRADGEAEADTGGGNGGWGGGAAAPSSVGALGRAPSMKSRAMLDALIASRAAASSGGAGLGGAGIGGATTPRSASMRHRPHSAAPLRGGTASGGSPRSRPRSAFPGSSISGAAPVVPRHGSLGGGGPGGALSRNPSMAHRAAGLLSSPAAAVSMSGAAAGAAALSLSPGVVAVPEGEFMALRQEVDAVSERLAATQAALEVQTDTEAQLREAVDMLRARLHASGLREVEAQRRLAQHSRLEPLFDRLGECFPFNSPEEVVARLEFLEDDKLGTFDQLLRTQEEVTKLQQRLAESQKATETVATQLTTENLKGSSRMQEQNEELRQELELMESLVNKLTARQAQLVALQTAVLQLWGRLSDDPAFAAAFGDGTGPGPGSPQRPRSPQSQSPARTRGGRGEAPTVPAAQIDLGDPLSMLHMIEEFVTAKSGPLAMQHFTDIQRVANHVWTKHFKHRNDIRGRVVPTIEQLSVMADKMADKVKHVQDRADRSHQSEKSLLADLKRMQLQKRALENELARRDELVKSIMGVPRSQRPPTARAELGRIMQREATSASLAPTSAAGGRSRAVSRAMSMASMFGREPSMFAARGGGGGGLGMAEQSTAAMSTYSTAPWRAGGAEPDSPAASTPTRDAAPGPPSMTHQAQAQAQFGPMSAASQTQQQLRRLRPGSAPSFANGGRRDPEDAARRAAARVRSRQGLYRAIAVAAQNPTVTSGGTLATVLSPGVASHVPQIVADTPTGAHWQSFSVCAVQQRAPSRLPAGGLFYDHGRKEEETEGGGTAAGSDAGPVSPSGGAAGGGGGGWESVPPSPGAVGPGSPHGVAAVMAGELEAPDARLPSARWAAPQRTAIEQAFLTRLERRTRVT